MKEWKVSSILIVAAFAIGVPAVILGAAILAIQSTDRAVEEEKARRIPISDEQLAAKVAHCRSLGLSTGYRSFSFSDVRVKEAWCEPPKHCEAIQ